MYYTLIYAYAHTYAHTCLYIFICRVWKITDLKISDDTHLHSTFFTKFSYVSKSYMKTLDGFYQCLDSLCNHLLWQLKQPKLRFHLISFIRLFSCCTNSIEIILTLLHIFIPLSTGTKMISNASFQKSMTVVLEDSYRRLAG